MAIDSSQNQITARLPPDAAGYGLIFLLEMQLSKHNDGLLLNDPARSNSIFEGDEYQFPAIIILEQIIRNHRTVKSISIRKVHFVSGLMLVLSLRVLPVEIQLSIIADCDKKLLLGKDHAMRLHS